MAEAEGSVRCGTEVDLGSGPAELGLERQHEDAEAPVVARDRDAQAEETRQGQRQRAPLLLLGHHGWGALAPSGWGAPARAGQKAPFPVLRTHPLWRSAPHQLLWRQSLPGSRTLPGGRCQ